jgi:hypothetical protein
MHICDEVLKKENKSGSHYWLDDAVHGHHHVAIAATARPPPQLHDGPARTTREEVNNSTSGNENPRQLHLKLTIICKSTKILLSLEPPSDFPFTNRTLE